MRCPNLNFYLISHNVYARHRQGIASVQENFDSPSFHFFSENFFLSTYIKDRQINISLISEITCFFVIQSYFFYLSFFYK